jgi:hypothetical protein
VVCCVFVRSSCLSPSPIRSFPSRNGHPPQARVKAVPLLLPLQRPTTRRRSQHPVQSSSAGAPRSRHSRPRSPSLQPNHPNPASGRVQWFHAHLSRCCGREFRPGFCGGYRCSPRILGPLPNRVKEKRRNVCTFVNDPSELRTNDANRFQILHQSHVERSRETARKC